MTQRAKKAMAESLKKLLAKKTLDKITIQDIVDDSGYNRQTFYYHFQDIYALLEWIFREDAREALETAGGGGWRQGVTAIASTMQQNKNLILNAYHSLSRDDLDRYINTTLYAFILDGLSRDGEENALPNLPDGEREFAARFISYAVAGYLLDWIRCGMREDPTQVFDRATRFLRDISAAGRRDET